MKSSVLVAWVCIVMAGVPGLATQARSEQPVSVAKSPDAISADAIKDELAPLHTQLWKSFAQRDLWQIGQLWAQNDAGISAIFPAASTPAIGWDNVADSFRRSFSHNRDIKTDTRIIRAYRSGDLAWLVATVRFEAVQTQTGQPVIIPRMLVTEIFTRRDGGWKLVHYHGHNPDFAPPMEGAESMTVSGTIAKRSSSPVWAAYDKFGAAFQQRKLGEMFNVLDGNADIAALQPTSPVPFLGLENVLASWKKTFADIESLSFDPQVLELSEAGNVAWVTDLSQFHIVFKSDPGQVRHFHNVMSTLIFRKEGEEWRLAHYHAHIGFTFDEHAH
jgi:ketosteroid isomerase-like protein